MNRMDQDLTRSRILILDDQKENTTLLEKIFSGAGFQELRCLNRPADFKEALGSFKPDIVLLDLMMPGLSGFDILDILRGEAKEGDFLPVIVLTADISRESKTRALESGAVDFLVKPFDIEEVVLRVRNLLVTRLLHQRLAAANEELTWHNHVLDIRVRDRTRELEDARVEILLHLATAAEYRDDDTGSHTRRVGRMAGRLARVIGLPEEDSRILALAGPLHDIGKIGISDTILLKPGKLTSAEYEIMKSHALIGGNILAGSRDPVLIKARELALSHHEKWDGSGYPEGLAGDDIPLSGRILAVVDVFDALSHDRPYRKAWPADAVIRHLREGAGRHFDPTLVEPFIESAVWEAIPVDGGGV